MARGYKRLTRKARHIIRHLKRTKHASVQDQMIHELRHEVSRTHGFRGPKKAPDGSKAGHWRPGTIISVAGNCAPIELARHAMGDVGWMTRDELAESIPPAFAEHRGRALLGAIEAGAAA